MTSTWQRMLGVGAASLMLLASPMIGVSAWAATPPDTTTTNPSEPAATSPVAPTPAVAPSTPTDAPSSTAATPTSATAAPASGARKPLGCVGVTPKKPWRLVASRPDPTASEVKVEWSPVGCTTGYRVNVAGVGVDLHIDVAGGTTSSATVPGLLPSLGYRITVTSVGATGDGGVSGEYGLRSSAPLASGKYELTIDFPDAGPTEPVAASAGSTSPWVNPELKWTADAASTPASFRLLVTSGGKPAVEKTLSGTADSARLGNEVAAGVSYTVTLTPVKSDGSDGVASRLTFGNQQAPRPEHVTGNAPVVQFSPVSEPDKGRVLGYELAFGGQQTSKHVFVSAPSAADGQAPWVALDPSFAAVDGSETALPLARMVAVVRTITTVGKSPWTPAQTIVHSDVATADSSYFAGIGHVGDGHETVPRNGFLTMRGATADLQVTDLVWSQSRHEQAVDVTVAVYGPDQSVPAFTQDVPVTHLPDGAQDAWRASDIPLPDGWTSIVLRRGGADVARWINTGGKPCVASVTYGDAPTDLPEMWKDSWCAA